ncbi:MAG TPA: DNA polymerase III subunit gamma/tau [Candidatus Alistipes merdigallinarum]|nr:DNA polymerase III subunit gamma/tau [Candidatus Alistipes merdigallinarum]
MDNFIVSARKYRPTTFASVVGQEHITSTLKNAISRHQLAHAYLFCGPRGVGKTTCARIFAKAINCLNPGPDAEACNECESCKAFNEGRSFNIHELDAASNNSVDDIRNLTEQVRIPPQIGQYSVFIIDEVHMLSVQAFNAFLKTLEEPPAHAIFILATTEKHKIIPTILSRCQIYDFNRIRVEDTVGYLKFIAEQEQVTYDDESLHIIARKADGGMRDALSMYDKVVSFCGSNLTADKVAENLNVLDYDTYFTVTDRILEGDYTATLLLFDEVLRKGFSGQTFIGGLNAHLRDLLMCKNPQTIPLLEVTGSVAERYKTQAAQCPVPLLFEGIDLLTTVDTSLRTTTNQRLHIELGLMKLCGLGQKKNEDSLKPALPELVSPQKATSMSGQVNPEPQTNSFQPPSTTTQTKTASKAEAVSETRISEPLRSPNPQKKHDGQTIEAPSNSENLLSGRSILSLLKSRSQESTAENTESDDQKLTPSEIPQQTINEPLLHEACRKLTQELLEHRPRLGAAFEEVRIEEATIILNVPNESLYDEVMHHLTEIQKRLCELYGAQLNIEFKVEIAASTKPLKPIKAEDRLQYLTEKNPLLTKLRQTLDLDIE